MTAWRTSAVIGMLLCILMTATANAKPHKKHQHYRSHHSTSETSAAAARGMVTVPTAAGIAITVHPEMASKLQGFIADVVARGYHPRRIHCFAVGGHVGSSWHYSGRACDFDQGGGGTAPIMRRVADLTKKWGLRNGCTFADCGHVDAGPAVSHSVAYYQARKHQRTRYAQRKTRVVEAYARPQKDD